MEERLAIAVELREIALGAGLHHDDLIIDPVLPNLSWPDATLHVREVVRTVRMLSGWSIFSEPVQTMIGLSNLRSGLRTRYALDVETTCLALLAGAGLNMALANVLQEGFIAAFQTLQPLVP